MFHYWMSRAFFVVLTAVNIVLFMNCSGAKFKNSGDSQQQTPENPKMGGGGIDGKPYYSYGECPAKPVDVVSSITVSNDFSRAWKTVENCTALAAPVAVDATRIKIAADDQSSIMFEGRAYITGPFSDGTTQASVAPIQRPALLNGYVKRPAWNVAGVDYAVGVPAATVLKNPAAINIPGVAVNLATHQVVVTANNVTLDGYDFSRDGGWSVRINGAASTRIVNSRFVETNSQASPPISTDAGASNLYVGYTYIDGGGAAASPSDGDLIQFNGRGLVTEYCVLKNAPSNIFHFAGGTGGGSLVIRFNLVEDSGRSTGGGGEYITFDSSAFNHIQVVFNTSYQTPGGTGTMGWNVDPDSVQTTETGNNVMIATAPGAAAYLTSIGTNTTAAVVHDNYFDLTGAFGFAYPGASGPNSIFSFNYDMKSGTALPDNP